MSPAVELAFRVALLVAASALPCRCQENTRVADSEPAMRCSRPPAACCTDTCRPPTLPLPLPVPQLLEQCSTAARVQQLVLLTLPGVVPRCTAATCLLAQRRAITNWDEFASGNGEQGRQSQLAWAVRMVWGALHLHEYRPGDEVVCLLPATARWH